MKTLILMICLTFVSAVSAGEVSTNCDAMNQGNGKKEIVVSKPSIKSSNGSSAQ